MLLIYGIQYAIPYFSNHVFYHHIMTKEWCFDNMQLLTITNILKILIVKVRRVFLIKKIILPSIAPSNIDTPSMPVIKKNQLYTLLTSMWIMSTGNPGVPDYYEGFMKRLEELKPDKKASIWCISHAGHVPIDKHVYNKGNN